MNLRLNCVWIWFSLNFELFCHEFEFNLILSQFCQENGFRFNFISNLGKGFIGGDFNAMTWDWANYFRNQDLMCLQSNNHLCRKSDTTQL